MLFRTAFTAPFWGRFSHSVCRHSDTFACSVYREQAGVRLNVVQGSSPFLRPRFLSMIVERISPEEAHRRKQCGDCDIHLDVRTPEEYKEAHAPNSILVPYMLKQGEKMVPNPDFLSQIEKVTGGDHDRRIIVNCASGRRSAMAAEELSKLGYKTIADMEGGMQQYLKHAHLPVNRAAGE
ncbi:hypothetical protein CCYA_CCYA05G1445 [Cyanidiococcus yangmingshanensis]|nr:hypothetical protein CCYA_CCYA05G1445 [Cyanidiococcus yangmingshanensis]